MRSPAAARVSSAEARRAMSGGAPSASKVAARSFSAVLSASPISEDGKIAQRRHGGAELLGGGHGVDRLRQAAQGPLHRAQQEALGRDQHADLRLGLETRIERLDLAPQVAQLPGVAHHGEGAGDRRGRRAGALADRAHEGRAAAVHQRVHHLQGRDLAAQAMAAELRLEFLLQGRREVAQQLAFEQRIVGQVGIRGSRR